VGHKDAILDERDIIWSATHDGLESAPSTPEPVEEDIELTPGAGLYMDFIAKTPAYTWLVTSLQREARLTRATPDIIESIRKKILDALPSYRKISRGALS
jgi:hypothetical protein